MKNNDRLIPALVAKANTPLLLKGHPGTGKTSYFQALAKSQDAFLFTMIASNHTPEDFGGIPFKTGSDGDESVRFATPEWALMLDELAESGQEVWCFLDELNTAPPAVQAPLLNIVLERKIGMFQMNKNVHMIAAMNPPETAAGGGELSAPLSNRFFHHNWTVDPREWAQGLMNDFPVYDKVDLPEDFEATHGAKHKAMVGAFMMVQQGILLDVPKDDVSLGSSWPSPRTWTQAARLMAAADAAGMGDEDTMLNLLIGSVGTGAGIEYMSYSRNQDLPNPEELLNGNTTLWDVNDEKELTTDRMFAVLNTLTSYVLGHYTQENGSKCLDLIAEAVELKHPDVAAGAAFNLLQTIQRDDKMKMPDLKKSLNALDPIFRAAKVGIYENTKEN